MILFLFTGENFNVKDQKLKKKIKMTFAIAMSIIIKD